VTVTPGVRPFRQLEALVQDARYGLRQLRRSPGFTVVAILTLALGIGVNTALFSLLDAALLKRLPVSHPEQLMSVIVTTRAGGWMTNVPTELFDELLKQERPFSRVFAFWQQTAILRVDGENERTMSQLVSGDYYATLGVSPFVGRLIEPTDDTGDGAAVAVLGYDFWVRRFHADPNVIDRTLFVDGIARTIIGITPPGFFGTDRAVTPDVTVPLGSSHHLSNLWVMGRRRDGVSLEQARSETALSWQRTAERLRPSLSRLRKSDRDEVLSRRADLIPGDKAGGGLGLRSQIRPLRILALLSALVLLIGCANIANLLLARAAARMPEFRTRLAVGASRRRIIEQLLVECGMLSVLGCALGVLFGFWAHRILTSFLYTGVAPTGVEFALDKRLLAFTLGVSIATTLLFGLVPALSAARLDLPLAFKRDRGSSARGVHLVFRNGLLVAQVSACVMLLVASFLLARTLANLGTVDRGLRADNLILIAVGTADRGSEGDRARTLYQELIAQAEAQSGVISASLAAKAVFGPSSWTKSIWVQGRSAEENQLAAFNVVAPGFFATTGIDLLLGRDFSTHDRPDTAKVVVVNETFARRYCSDRGPIGCRFGDRGPASSGTYEVVGVVRDAKYKSLREGPGPVIYEGLMQEERASAVTLHVRVRDSAALVGSRVRADLRLRHPNLPIDAVRTVAAQIDDSLRQERMMAILSGFFGSLALLLTSIGLFGTVAHGVERRMREIAVRIALGASPSNVLRVVLRQTMVLIAVGASLGVAVALVVVRVLESLLYGLSPADPASLIGAILVLLAVAAAAGYLPARHAIRLDPMAILRHE
jgi:putative ABC transport system permease protein